MHVRCRSYIARLDRKHFRRTGFFIALSIEREQSLHDVGLIVVGYDIESRVASAFRKRRVIVIFQDLLADGKQLAREVLDEDLQLDCLGGQKFQKRSHWHDCNA